MPLTAIMDGYRIAFGNLWEAADLLRLPPSGTYVVIATRVPDIGNVRRAPGERR